MNTNQKTWYVYMLCDPDTGQPFYVGKGTGERMNRHEQCWNSDKNSRKKRVIQAISASGKEVLKRKVAEFDYVINQNGNPLMPCKPSKARKLLRDGRARVERRSPFTIQLLWDCEEHVQEILAGIDKGSHITGLSCVGKKEHDVDALCIATYQSGEAIPYHRERFYSISFRPRRTRRQYRDLPCKGQGRVKYQVNEVLAGFRKGDVVRVKGKYVKQINSIYSSGRLAFKRVKGQPAAAQPKDCQLLERGQTILWEKVT